MPKNVLVIPSIVGGTSGGDVGGGAVDSVNGKTGVVVLTKTDLGLGNVDNTSDLNKPISIATQSALNLKANSADVYTKSEVDAKLSSALHFKGTVNTVDDLNSVQNPQIGDMYNVDATGANYAWDGSKWDKLSETIDLTPFLTKEEASSVYATQQQVSQELDTKQNSLSEEQIAAVNSGITAEHVATYNSYAAEISSVEQVANKADTAAEVAQQTANLIGQNLQQVTEKIPTTASATNLLVDTSTLNTSLADKVDLSALSAVATSGSYNDLSDKPSIPEAYTLPTASTTVLGGVKVDGSTITISDGTITAHVTGESGTTDYSVLTNKPQINSVELSGNKTLSELGIQPAGDYALTSAIPTKVSQLQNDSNFLTSVPAEYVTETELSAKNYATAEALTSGLATKANTEDLATVATSGSYNDLINKPTIVTSYNDLTDKPDIPEAYTLPTASISTLGGVKVDGTTITVTAEGVISAPVVNTPVATAETAGIVKPDGRTFEMEEDGTLVNKVAGSNCYIYGLKGIGSDDITIAADTTTTIPVGRLRNYNYESGDRLKVGDMLIDLKGNVAKVDRVNTAALPAGSGPFGVNESSVLVQLQTREDDTLTTSSKEIVGAINELKTATDSKTSKPASYAKAELPAASEHFGEFAIVTDQDNMLVWSNGTAWKQVTLTDLA